MNNSFLWILVLVFSLGAVLAAWAGIRSIQSARSVVFYRTRQARMLTGRQWLAFSLALVLFAFGSLFFGQPLASRFLTPTAGPTASPAWTITLPSVTVRTETMIASQTPVESGTATGTATPSSLASATTTLSSSWMERLNGTQTALAAMTQSRSTFIARLSATPTVSRTPIPTWTRTPSSTPRPTYTASPTRTPRPTLTRLPTRTASPTRTPVTPPPTRTPSPTRTPTSTLTLTSTPTRAATATP